MEDKLQGILDLHDYVREVMEERRTSRRDDLISHVWEMRDSGQVEMTDFEMLSMFPGLILAGHKITTNLLSTGLSHLLQTGQYEAAQENDESRARAIEELLRYESAITGMRRKVLSPTQLGGTDLKPGDEVFLAYASGAATRRTSTIPTCWTSTDPSRMGTSASAGASTPASEPPGPASAGHRVRGHRRTASRFATGDPLRGHRIPPGR